MSAIASFSHGIAGRYATALFELAREAKNVDTVEKDLDALQETLSTSDELRELITSPVYSRDQQGGVMAEIGQRLGLSREVANTIALMAAKRRLFTLPSMISSVKALIAQEKGEVTAEVTSAKPLTDAQRASLVDNLKKAHGKDIKINLVVDESILGGLIVKVGSQMVDTSIATKLSKLQNTMKEVG